jgi:hypothetical protein
LLSVAGVSSQLLWCAWKLDARASTLLVALLLWFFRTQFNIDAHKYARTLTSMNVQEGTQLPIYERHCNQKSELIDIRERILAHDRRTNGKWRFLNKIGG